MAGISGGGGGNITGILVVGLIAVAAVWATAMFSKTFRGALNAGTKTPDPKTQV